MDAVYVDIPRAYTAIAEWAACMVYLRLFHKLTKGKFAAVSMVALAVQILYLVTTADIPVFFWIPCMIGAVALMFLFLKGCVGMPLISTGYCCARAFLLAEFVASLEWQLHIFVFDIERSNFILQQLFFLLVYGILFSLAYALESRMVKVDYITQTGWNDLLSVLGVVVIVFAFSNLSFVSSGLPFTSDLPREIYNIRTLVDLGGLATLYAFQSRIGEYIAERELTAINNVLRTQYEQYRNYQTSVEMMNMKYHDLKHQIMGLRAEKDQDRRMEWLDTMEQEIESYHHKAFRTGNQVLDTILETKMFQCQKNHIQFTCVADGKLLDHIHVVDICNIFGNALDNAIESVVLLPEEEKRLIHLSLSAVKEFVYIKVENYCETQMEELSQGELPKTSKQDAGNHGYGLKSIRYTAEKNGGTCDIKWNNNWFELRILLPK